MKNKRTLTIAAIAAALAILAAFGIFRNTTPVKAQDQQPPPINDRISFGMVGITAGQTIRINVTDIQIPPPIGDLPPGPYRVVMAFRGMNGQLVRDRNGDVVRRAVDLERGDSTFLDLDFDQWPPGPIRVQLRPVVTVQQPPNPETNELPPIGDRIASTVEVINNANGRTQFAVFTHPAVVRGFNPQPDPPAEP